MGGKIKHTCLKVETYLPKRVWGWGMKCKKETQKEKSLEPLTTLPPEFLDHSLLSGWAVDISTTQALLHTKEMPFRRKEMLGKHSHSQSLEDTKRWPQGLHEDTDVQSTTPRPTRQPETQMRLAVPETQWWICSVHLYIYWAYSTIKKEANTNAPLLLVRFTRNWITRQNVLTDKTGTNNNVPNAGTLQWGKSSETFWETRYLGR